MLLRGPFVFRNYCFLVLLLCTFSLKGQSRLDLSVHFTPQLRYATSERNNLELEPGASLGESGIAFGYNFGGAIEFRVLDELYLRGGIDFVHKRQEYSVSLIGNGNIPVSSGSNLVTYQAIEVPVQAIYRFGFHKEKANFLVGVGVVAFQFAGDPKVKTTLSKGDLTGFESLVTRGRSFSIFGGYDRYISRRVIASIEPYLSYVPDEIRLETHTTARVIVETGIRLRLTLDN